MRLSLLSFLAMQICLPMAAFAEALPKEVFVKQYVEASDAHQLVSAIGIWLSMLGN